MPLRNQLSLINIRHILLLAFTLRVVWAMLVPVETTSDSFLYDAFAKSIANGTGYAFPAGNLTAYWPVGTSAVYAFLYNIFGVSTTSIIVFNIIIGVLTVWLTYALTLRYINIKSAILASFFVAAWPILIQFTTILASELIFIVLILAALYIWGKKEIKPIIRATLWATLICSATYVRPTALVLIVVLPILELLNKETIRKCLTSLGIATITVSILFAPWVYRNYQVFDQFVLVSANGGANLWMGNHDGATGGYTQLPEMSFKNEVERDQYFKKEAINYITKNPIEYIKLVAKRAVITYKSETIGVVWNSALDKMLNQTAILILKAISSLYWWLMLILAAIGLFKLLKKGEMPIFNVLIVTFGFFFIFPLLTVAQDRYHMPINPFLAMFAAYASIALFGDKQQTPNLNANSKIN